MAVKPATAAKKTTTAPVAAKPAAAKPEKVEEKKAAAKPVAVKKAEPAKKEAAKPAAKPAAKVVAAPKNIVPKTVKKEEPAKAKTTSTGKTIYHVSKRGETKADRVWKVFIQGSDKVIKLFDTQQEALDYAKGLAENKKDGSTVMLHGLDGKIRKY